MRLKDHLAIGVIAGIIGPLCGMAGFYLYNFSKETFGGFLELSISKGLLSPLLSLCAVINLGIFYLFLKTNLLYSARGVILSTFLVGLVIITLKFIL